MLGVVRSHSLGFRDRDVECEAGRCACGDVLSSRCDGCQRGPAGIPEDALHAHALEDKWPELTTEVVTWTVADAAVRPLGADVGGPLIDMHRIGRDDAGVSVDSSARVVA